MVDLLRYGVQRRFANQNPLGAYATGQISDEERQDVVRHACPGRLRIPCAAGFAKLT